MSRERLFRRRRRRAAHRPGPGARWLPARPGHPQRRQAERAATDPDTARTGTGSRLHYFGRLPPGARALAGPTGLPAVADDSGLCVDVLGGAPGIFSARWSGRHGDDTANLQLLLAQLADVADPHRSARFTCAAVLVQPASGRGPEQVTTIERSMEGRLTCSPLGEGGFGYDPIFVPVQEDEPGCRGRTTAQMTSEDKHAISHRGQAFRALAPVLAELLNQ